MTTTQTVGGTQITLTPFDNGMSAFVRVTFDGKGAVQQGTIDRVIDCTQGVGLDWAGAETVRAKGGTHAAILNLQGAEPATLVLTVEAAEAIRAAERVAAQTMSQRQAEAEAASRALAEAACPEGYVVARRQFSATNLYDDRVVTADGVSVSGLDAQPSGESRFAFVRAERIAEVGAAQRVRAAEANERDAADAADAAEPIPAEARVAWTRYAGSAELAWKRGDERAWALIRRHYAVGGELRDRRRRESRTLASGWYGDEGDVA